MLGHVVIPATPLRAVKRCIQSLIGKESTYQLFKWASHVLDNSLESRNQILGRTRSRKELEFSPYL